MSKINLQISGVSIREIRLGSITGFQGGAEELVNYSHCGLKDKSRSFSQCLGCSTSQAAYMVILVQDVAMISHGPVGCSSCFHEFAFTYWVDSPLRGVEHPIQREIFSINLQETDTVYSGAQKPTKGIHEVYERTYPNAVFVLTTCAAGIIGDDMEGVCGEAGEGLGVPVIAIFYGGFRSKVWTTGLDASYHAIARKLIQLARGRRSDMISVINFWGSDVFGNWFEAFGAKSNYITPYSTIENLRRSSEVVASVQVCPTLGSYLGATPEQEFGVPEINAVPSYDITQTDRQFCTLGKLLHKKDEAERLIVAKRAEYLPKIGAPWEKLRGKIAHVTVGAAYGHALLNLLGEPGMKVRGTAIFHHDPIYGSENKESDLLVNRVKEYGDVLNFNICNKQEFELVNALNRLQSDILLARHGGITLWGVKLGIPSPLIGDKHFSMGYEGVVRYGERILETIENNEFMKNLKQHAINPYTKWWLDQEPYTFLKGSATK